MSKKQKRSKNHQKNNITKGIFTVLERFCFFDIRFLKFVKITNYNPRLLFM